MKNKNIWDCFLAALKKYSELKGRATRKEYWSFSFVFSIVVISQYAIVSTLYFLFEENILSEILIAFMFVSYFATCIFLYIPHIAVSVRRLHDTNHTSWWLWIPGYNLVLMCRRGDASHNRFGPHPEHAGVVPSQDDHQEVKAKPVVPLTHDVLALLETLGRLREQGIITEEEFQEQKRKIL